MRGKDPITTKRGPLLASQRFAGVPTMAQHCILAWKLCDFFQVIRTSIARKPYIFVIFIGGGGYVIKKKIFINQNICCGYSKEPSQ